MAEDKLQQQRLELKYIIEEATALRLRDYLSSYLEIDEFGATRPNFSYPVHSLYLDSDSLLTYWETINGTKNRYKLRLRFYDNRPEAPVYFEIKRRMNNCILKQRGGVRRDAVDWLLAGHLPEPSHLCSNAPKNLVALQNFCYRMMSIHARPKAHISYLREAWVSPHDNSIRITFDREIQCEPEFTSQLSITPRQPTLTYGKMLVLEVKFTISGQPQNFWNTGDEYIMDLKSNFRPPPWFGHMIQTFGLTQTGAAKYVEGISVYGENYFYDDGESPPTLPVEPGAATLSPARQSQQLTMN